MLFRIATSASLAVLAALAATAQEFKPAEYAEDAYAKPVYEGYVPPKNNFGQPDISGIWSNGTTTRFERPERYGDRLALTEEEAGRVQGAAESYRVAGDAQTDPDAGAPDDKNTNLGYNRFWTDPGTQVMRVGGEPRTSMITYPANGRVPPRKAGAPELPASANREVLDESNPMAGPRDNPEERGLSERCIFFPTSAAPVMRPTLYNNNYRITQGQDAVAIWIEMTIEQKIIRLNSKHRNDGVRPWGGDSIGWYEGDTLVVETVDLHPEQFLFNASENVKVTERFTRVADNRLLYQFEIDDPTVWDEPWGGEYEFWAANGIYEYACHEGNVGLEGILAGGRQSDLENGR